ncbi:hypothetical protein CEXT_390351 [Caerostris extrusa]|uniref:Uncharacterized protein n=1 Tax=Caerostris extrusa TaxID=172846 RepID=A0AAV4MKY1_CAEEX|nr:hypothetical protein CEXT_390351 [Caerostris extrusa]
MEIEATSCMNGMEIEATSCLRWDGSRSQELSKWDENQEKELSEWDYLEICQNLEKVTEDDIKLGIFTRKRYSTRNEPTGVWRPKGDRKSPAVRHQRMVV